MLSDFTCQCPGIQNDASCSVRVTNSSAILSGCFSSSKVATQVKGVGVRCTRGSVRLSDIQAVRKHLNDSIPKPLTVYENNENAAALLPTWLRCDKCVFSGKTIIRIAFHRSKELSAQDIVDIYCV